MTDTLDLIHPQLRSLAVPIADLNEDPNNANTHDEFGQATLVKLFVKEIPVLLWFLLWLLRQKMLH